MNGKTAGYLFMAVCLILAILLITRVISPIVSSVIFAVALVILGLLSGGFRKST